MSFRAGSHFFQNPFAEGSVARVPTAAMVLFSPVETGKTSQNADRLEDQIDQSRCQISLCGMECSFPKFARSDFGGEAGDGTGADVTHQQIPPGLNFPFLPVQAGSRYLSHSIAGGKALQESHRRRRFRPNAGSRCVLPGQKAVPVPILTTRSGFFETTERKASASNSRELIHLIGGNAVDIFPDMGRAYSCEYNL